MNKWKYISTVVQGLNHKERNIPTQDAITIMSGNNSIACVLSDGLGSKNHSELASQSVCDSLAAWLTGNKFETLLSLDESSLRHYVYKICQGAIERESINHGVSLNTMDCTLLFVCVNDFNNKAIIGKLGDGSLNIFKKNEGALFNNFKKRLTNETYTVLGTTPSDDLLKLDFIDLDENNILGFILTSDGLQGEIYDSFQVCKKSELYFNAINEKNPNDSLKILVENAIKNSAGLLDDDISIIVLSRAKKTEHVCLPDNIMWPCQCGYQNGLDQISCGKCHRDFISIYEPVIPKFQQYGGKYNFFKEMMFNPVMAKEVSDLVGFTIKAKESNNIPGPEETRIIERDDLSRDPVIIDDQPAKIVDNQLNEKRKPNESTRKIKKMYFKRGLLIGVLLGVVGLGSIQLIGQSVRDHLSNKRDQTPLQLVISGDFFNIAEYIQLNALYNSEVESNQETFYEDFEENEEMPEIPIKDETNHDSNRLDLSNYVEY